MYECRQGGRESAQDGSALVWALFFVSLTTGILVAHSIEMSANRRTMDTRYRRVDQAHTIAESGLTDATSYMRRQPSQPVTAFAPQLDLGADPPVNDTLDPAIGLVREFEVHGNLWGRYEVRSDEAIDVSAHYGEPGGTVWDVGARGYLFEVVDKSKPFDKAPNRVISTQSVRTELRGMSLQLPAQAAVLVDNTDLVQMLGMGDIAGGAGPAIAYRQPAIPVLPVLDVAITGTPAAVSIVGLDLSLGSVFGMRMDQVRSVADIVLLSPRQIYGRVLRDQAVYVPTSLDVDGTRLSLRGRMLLVVNGNFTAAAGNNSDFSGVVYVTGATVIEGPFQFRGTMISLGTFKVGGTPDAVSITSDAGEVTQLQTALSQYRVSRDKRPSGSSGAFAQPSDLADMK